MCFKTSPESSKDAAASSKKKVTFKNDASEVSSSKSTEDEGCTRIVTSKIVTSVHTTPRHESVNSSQDGDKNLDDNDYVVTKLAKGKQSKNVIRKRIVTFLACLCFLLSFVCFIIGWLRWKTE